MPTIGSDLRYVTEAHGPFPGIGGAYKLIRLTAGKRAKVELYKITDDGLEVFLGYVPASAWQRRRPCELCGADAHQPYWATGAVTPQGTVMQSVHANRKRG
jgi:hypothetical protein